MVECGARGGTALFTLSDTQVIEESFLEMVNTLLTAGDVPAAWTNEERAKSSRGESSPDNYNAERGTQLLTCGKQEPNRINRAGCALDVTGAALGVCVCGFADYLRPW